MVRQLKRVYNDKLAGVDFFYEFVENYTENQQCQISSLLISLEEAKSNFESAREKLLTEHEECDTVELLTEKQAFYGKFHRVKGFLLEKQDGADGHRPAANSTMANASFTNSQVRLPKIDLPAFDGDKTKWMSFKDRFTAMVHDAELSDIMKVQYLLASLKGDAARLFDHVKLVEGNYNSTWQALLDRFDDAKMLKRNYFKALVDLQPMAAATAEELTRIVNESKRLVLGMDRLQEPVSSWDTPLSSLVRYKFDEQTLMAFELIAAEQKTDTFKALMEFCERRIKILTNSVVHTQNRIDTRPATRGTNHDHQSTRKPTQRPYPASMSCAAQTGNMLRGCVLCKADHHIARCERFAKMSLSERQQIAKVESLCFNCLGKEHQARFCKAQSRCGNCQKRHHTLVCNKTNPITPRTESSISATTYIQAPVDSQPPQEKMIWLSTAQVLICNDEGREFPARALLDQGSQSNFMSERLVQQLKLKKRRLNKPLSGIGAVSLKAETMVGATMKSRASTFVSRVNWLVLRNITANFPAQTRNTESWNIPQALILADPAFFRSERIDLLIGAELFGELLQQGQLKLAPHLPKLLESSLGWIVCGREERVSEDAAEVVCSCLADNDLGAIFEKLASLEAIPEERVRSEQDEECENLYLNTTRRTESGRYVVKLPKVANFEERLGDSLQPALKRLAAIERRMIKEPNLGAAYKEFMSEYIRLGHMTKVSTYVEDKMAEGTPRFYLPHQAVWKTDGLTKKCRVVFDASCRCGTGLSLNDILLTGPRLQDDIEVILLRFRMRPVAFVADVEKMYRQVLVAEEDKNLQRILWRETANDPVGVYVLNTVTYGTACAPFLAIRTLFKIFEDEGHQFPMASRCANDFYVDDILSGAATIEEAGNMVKELSELLSMGGFGLRKWASNEPEALAAITPEHIAKAGNYEFGTEPTGTVSTLGLSWNTSSAVLSVQVRLPPQIETLRTKRQVSGCLAKVYDPLGFLDPVKMKAKLLLQRIVTLKDAKGKRWDWDDVLPEGLFAEWMAFFPQLTALSKIEVPRPVVTDSSMEKQVHIFCDASERGYGACCYIRCQKVGEKATVNFFISKSKLVSLKQKITIARLELCAALLGSNIYRLVKKVLPEGAPAFLWTDSMTVWHWVNSPHGNWKTFVANRTSKIQRNAEGAQWRHVPGVENPADLVSRGVDPEALIDTKQWWSGPTWLSLEEESWPALPNNAKALEPTGEERATAVLASSLDEENFSDRLYSLCSTYTKLRRVVGYCQRYLHALRSHAKPTSEEMAPLTTEDLRKAESTLCRLAQREQLAAELDTLKKGRSLPSASDLRFCDPFLGEDGLIRVKGRLQNAHMSEAAKHPIIIPKGHPLARLLALHYHVNLLHAGPQLMLTSLRQRFWIMGVRSVVRQVQRQCVSCFKNKPKLVVQPMGELPAARVAEARPFAISGVDYCGPVYIKGGHRKAAPTKAYIAVFVCFVTRAVHLELVSSLSTAAFIAALRRFVSKRGLVAELHSDNGTNFKGAANELRKLYDLLSSSQFQAEVTTWSSERGLKWSFIPPGAPHFGGLWEAAVKSMKRHLHRVLGDAATTYEDMVTLLAQVECCLNSRPITPMSDDPADLEALTPGHFITGSNMQQVPDIDLRDIPEGRLNHWRVIQQRFQHFWARWRSEYLHQLHVRNKWSMPATAIEPGIMVIIRDDNMPPNKWPLARVIEVHPGKDGIVRVVTLRTAQSDKVKRPVAKLCVLPFEGNRKEGGKVQQCK
ncbi:uncharacterized protein LOC131292908 [Anopheles ziemanni]|uniref:uncharacterized protein LOC131271258 n=2 Tax=Anopheles coustani TaxID=139045 RepID=UPI0026598274|nr:uncharacterized protein LOC131271258 [Anopheles coustani]XP_058176990.1 uncharacterized protein LOC131292908 [Anopheles ziemanni]